MQNHNPLPDFHTNSIGITADELFTYIKSLFKYLVKVFCNINSSSLDI